MCEEREAESVEERGSCVGGGGDLAELVCR